MSTDVERELRGMFVGSTLADKERASILIAMWFQCVVSLDMQFTMKAFDSGRGFTACVRDCVDAFTAIFEKEKNLSKVDIFKILCPLSRFYCSFVPKQEIDIDLDILPAFEPHPKSNDFYAITPQGLAYLMKVVKPFFAYRQDLRSMKWTQVASESPASPEEVARALDMAKGRGDSYATDELLDTVRQRVIGRLMPPYAIYDVDSEMARSSKDMYLVMREVDPDNLNDAHRQGSVPMLLALQDKNRTVQKEILVASILLAPTKSAFLDATYCDLPPPPKVVQPAVGYYCGQYVVVERDGTFLHGFGSGLAGVVGAALYVMKDRDKLGYNYVVGEGRDYRPSLHEVEYANSNCF